MADEGDRKLWAAIAWGLGLLGLILVLVTDKKSDKELKFYGVQSTLLGVGLFVLNIALGIASLIIGVIPVIGGILSVLFGLVTLVIFPVYGLVWLYGLWKAYTLEHFSLPVLGKLAEDFSGKL